MRLKMKNRLFVFSTALCAFSLHAAKLKKLECAKIGKASNYSQVCIYEIQEEFTIGGVASGGGVSSGVGPSLAVVNNKVQNSCTSYWSPKSELIFSYSKVVGGKVKLAGNSHLRGGVFPVESSAIQEPMLPGEIPAQAPLAQENVNTQYFYDGIQFTNTFSTVNLWNLQVQRSNDLKKVKVDVSYNGRSADSNFIFKIDTFESESVACEAQGI